MLQFPKLVVFTIKYKVKLVNIKVLQPYNEKILQGFLSL